jgi:acetyltransferase-like isoleucine patch superfamily enzyme
MFKQIIKKMAHKIYELGYHEARRVNFDNKILELRDKVIFDSAEAVEEAIVYYNQKEKNKIRIGSNTIVKAELLVFSHGGEIEIGEYCYIGSETKIWSSKKISIGNRVLIAHNVNIHDNISHSLISSERHVEYQNILTSGEHSDAIKSAEIFIEDDVWIGFNSTILKGVKIGKGAVIGANAVVTKDILPYSIVVGNPMKVIGSTT